MRQKSDPAKRETYKCRSQLSTSVEFQGRCTHLLFERKLCRQVSGRSIWLIDSKARGLFRKPRTTLG